VWGSILELPGRNQPHVADAIVMVMDQSASMNHRLKSGQSKAAFLADVLNKTLYTLITSVDVGDGTIIVLITLLRKYA
jgi:hypothetical protein